jgi:hypothetical protein
MGVSFFAEGTDTTVRLDFHVEQKNKPGTKGLLAENNGTIEKSRQRKRPPRGGLLKAT